MKNIIRPLKTIVLALVIGLSIGYVMAWSAPTAPPPGANVPAPVNVGSETQYKSGLLGVGPFQTFLDTYLATEGANVGIGTTEPQRQLQIYGSLPVIGLKTQDQLGWSIYVDPSDGSLNFNRQVNGEWTGSKNRVKITTNGKPQLQYAWVGYKWVRNGSEISCTTPGVNYNLESRAKVKNGNIQIRMIAHKTDGGSTDEVVYDSGWQTKRGLFYDLPGNEYAGVELGASRAFSATSGPEGYDLFGYYYGFNGIYATGAGDALSPCSANW